MEYCDIVIVLLCNKNLCADYVCISPQANSIVEIESGKKSVFGLLTSFSYIFTFLILHIEIPNMTFCAHYARVLPKRIVAELPAKIQPPDLLQLPVIIFI